MKLKLDEYFLPVPGGLDVCVNLLARESWMRKFKNDFLLLYGRGLKNSKEERVPYAVFRQVLLSLDSLLKELCVALIRFGGESWH